MNESPSRSMRYEAICPVCLSQHDDDASRTEPSICPDCDSEAIAVPLEPLWYYLAVKSEADFDQMLAKWSALEGFRPEYKAQKTQRIMDLRDLKHRQSAKPENVK